MVRVALFGPVQSGRQRDLLCESVFVVSLVRVDGDILLRRIIGVRYVILVIRKLPHRLEPQVGLVNAVERLIVVVKPVHQLAAVRRLPQFCPLRLRLGNVCVVIALRVFTGQEETQAPRRVEGAHAKATRNYHVIPADIDWPKTQCGRDRALVVRIRAIGSVRQPLIRAGGGQGIHPGGL